MIRVSMPLLTLLTLLVIVAGAYALGVVTGLWRRRR